MRKKSARYNIQKYIGYEGSRLNIFIFQINLFSILFRIITILSFPFVISISNNNPVQCKKINNQKTKSQQTREPFPYLPLSRTR